MSGLRLITLFTLSAFWLSSFSFGGATGISRDACSSSTRLEKPKLVQLLTFARTEQVKVGTNQDNSPEKTPIHWLRFTSPALRTVWQISAVKPSEHVRRLAPSLTGIVVLQI